MNIMDRPIAPIRNTAAAGFSLIEVLVSMGITVSIMGATMQTMTHAIRANQAAMLVTGMNSSLRTGMDVMVRDLLQVGQGLPNGGLIFIPSGSQINLPGPPGQTGVSGGTTSTPYTSVAGDPDIPAFFYATIFTDGLSGIAMLAFVVVSARSLRSPLPARA